MVPNTIWKACLLTAVACLAALPGAAADPPENADDGSGPSADGEPCQILLVGLEPPYVDPHPECLPVDLPP